MNPSHEDMNPSHEDQDRLERLIERALREQPLLQAPPGLEARVLAEIERRAARPWWQKSFSHWPIAARVAFVIASIGCVKVGLQAAMWIIKPLDSAALAVKLPSEVTWIETLVSAIASVGHYLPPLWVYGALAILAVMYIALFGISAAAYRTLYAAR